MKINIEIVKIEYIFEATSRIDYSYNINKIKILKISFKLNICVDHNLTATENYSETKMKCKIKT